MHTIQETGRGVGRATRNGESGIARFAKRDSVPLALVGVGLAWLITDGVRHRTNSNGNPAFHGRRKEERHHSESGRGGRRSEKLREKAHAAVDTLADAAETAAERVTHRANEMGHTIGNSAHQLRTTMRNRPYVTAAASLASVAALGALTYAVRPHR